MFNTRVKTLSVGPAFVLEHPFGDRSSEAGDQYLFIKSIDGHVFVVNGTVEKITHEEAVKKWRTLKGRGFIRGLNQHKTVTRASYLGFVCS